MALFERYIGVDDSGAQTAESSLPGLRVNGAESSNDVHGRNLRQALGSFRARRGVAELALRKIWGRCPGLNRGLEPARYQEIIWRYTALQYFRGRLEGAASSADLGLKLFPPEVELIDSFLRQRSSAWAAISRSASLAMAGSA